jgi:outer membrane protein assembly factor BamB
MHLICSAIAISQLLTLGFVVQAQTAAETPKPPKIEIHLDSASQVPLPQLAHDLKPAAFTTADGRAGWVLKIPGNRPIATPAYADGMVFVGGGYGSHEFYAFNAETGDLVWKIATQDDGPTAAVVESGYVAFNTESCTVIVVDEKTGKIVWQEWLGDPLMSQPAIAGGKLFIAYPAGQRNHKQQGSSAHTAGGTHHLLAAELKSGRHLWEQEITGDVISAPVVAGEIVYVTSFDGTSFAFHVADGHLLWKKDAAATSAPTIAGGQVVVTRKELSGSSTYEGLTRMDSRGRQKEERLLAKDKADYLKSGNGGGVAISSAAQKQLDSSVGFAAAPTAAKLSAAEKNVGVNSVAGGWAYQGSRAAYQGGQFLNAQGQYLNALNATTGGVNWRAEVKGSKVNGAMQVFSPPSLGREYMYLSSGLGHLVSVRQKDGKIGFNYSFKEPIVFQPALARGNVYAGTASGLLICLKTGSNDADGWYAWGGNAAHNKN